jgi:hypothetical protein
LVLEEYYIISIKSKKCFIKLFLFISSVFFAVVALMIALALWLGDPGTPAPIASINAHPHGEAQSEMT